MFWTFPSLLMMISWILIKQYKDIVVRQPVASSPSQAEEECMAAFFTLANSPQHHPSRNATYSISTKHKNNNSSKQKKKKRRRKKKPFIYNCKERLYAECRWIKNLAPPIQNTSIMFTLYTNIEQYLNCIPLLLIPMIPSWNDISITS